MQKFLAVMLSIVTTAICLAQTRAHATHATPLFHATREYRDATHYLVSMLTYHAILDPPQRMFLKRLRQSSEQLYAAACGSLTNAAFTSTWTEVRSLAQELPWMLERLPPHVQRSLLAKSREFLQSFQTLAFQIELREQMSCRSNYRGPSLPLGQAPLPLGQAGGNAMGFHPQGSPIQGYSFSPFCPCQRCQSLVWSNDDSRAPLVNRHHPTLSPSEWQLRQSEPQHRGEAPVSRKNVGGKAISVGARLSRIGVQR